jgi:hypothetical protein
MGDNPLANDLLIYIIWQDAVVDYLSTVIRLRVIAGPGRGTNDDVTGGTSLVLTLEP